MLSLHQLLHTFFTPGLKGIDLSLERVRGFLEAVGHPEKRLPPVVHVAGTNGKGSTVATLKAIAKAANLSAHVYTSPDLVRFNERIVLNHEMIADEALVEVLLRVKANMPERPLTFFEATCMAGFMAFAEHPADLLLLEVGMGGRLDATNVVDRPLVTVITPVSMDHCQFLGNTLAEIAREKAGILKPGVPCVVARQEASALAAIRARAQEVGAPLYVEGEDWEVTGAGEGGFTYRSSAGKKHFPKPALEGAHQFHNAALAAACVEKMHRFAITDAHVGEGIARAVWPGRLQLLTRGALVDALPGFELRLDGGHNPGGAEVLAAWIQSTGRAVHVICGMLAHKDIAGFLRPLAPHIAALHAVTIPGEEESAPAGAVAAAAAALGIKAHAAENLLEATRTIAAVASAPATVLVCGSLYLAGYVLRDHV